MCLDFFLVYFLFLHCTVFLLVDHSSENDKGTRRPTGSESLNENKVREAQRHNLRIALLHILVQGLVVQN